ncbi:MAG: hypothetical protein RSF88_06095 [Lachnospiraceae bacterium]
MQILLYQSVNYINGFTGMLISTVAGLVSLRILLILLQALLEGELQNVWIKVKNKLLASIVITLIPVSILFLKKYYVG